MQYSSLSLFSEPGMPSTQRKIRYELKIPPWSMKGWKNVQLWSWSYSNQNSRSGSVYLSVNPSLRSTAAACKWIFLRNQDFKMSAPKPSQFIQNLPQNQLLNLRQKSGQAMTRDWVIPMWFWSISSFPKSTKNPPGWALGGRSQFGSSGGNGWGIKSPLWTVLQKCGTKQQLLAVPQPLSEMQTQVPSLKGHEFWILHPLSFQILKDFTWKLFILHKGFGEIGEKQLSWKSVQKSCMNPEFQVTPKPQTTPQILTTSTAQIEFHFSHRQHKVRFFQPGKSSNPALLKLNFTPSTANTKSDFFLKKKKFLWGMRKFWESSGAESWNFVFSLWPLCLKPHFVTSVHVGTELWYQILTLIAAHPLHPPKIIKRWDPSLFWDQKWLGKEWKN